MAEHQHEHGSMDISVQEKTFDGFVKMTKWAVTIIVVALILLALLNA